MTRDEAKKLLPVIQAFAEGKDIEVHYPNSIPWMWEKGWVPVETPSWDKVNEYRIKPEPLECWVVKNREGDLYARPCKDSAEEMIKYGNYAPYTIHHMREVL